MRWKHLALIFVLSTIVANADTPVLGGRKQNASEEVKKHTGKFDTEVGSCTATVFGNAKKKVLTAAHCLRGRSATFTLQGQQFPLHCIGHPQFGNQRSGTDIAVCEFVNGKGPSGGGDDLCIPSEALQKGDPVVMAGLGGSNQTNLTEGDSQVHRMESGTIITKRDPSTPNLVSGDSGGPIFTKKDGKLRLVGVNSAYRSDGTNVHPSTAGNRSFLASNGVEFCEGGSGGGSDDASNSGNEGNEPGGDFGGPPRGQGGGPIGQGGGGGRCPGPGCGLGGGSAPESQPRPAPLGGGGPPLIRGSDCPECDLVRHRDNMIVPSLYQSSTHY